jgi:hypothetical protein
MRAGHDNTGEFPIAREAYFFSNATLNVLGDHDDCPVFPLLHDTALIEQRLSWRLSGECFPGGPKTFKHH